MTYDDFHCKLLSWKEGSYASDDAAARALEERTRRLGLPVSRQSVRWHLDGTYRDVKLSVLNLLSASMGDKVGP